MRRLLKQYYVREFLSREKKWDETGNSTDLIGNVLPRNRMGSIFLQEKQLSVMIIDVKIFPVLIFPVVIFMREI